MYRGLTAALTPPADDDVKLTATPPRGPAAGATVLVTSDGERTPDQVREASR